MRRLNCISLDLVGNAGYAAFKTYVYPADEKSNFHLEFVMFLQAVETTVGKSTLASA